MPLPTDPLPTGSPPMDPLPGPASPEPPPTPSAPREGVRGLEARLGAVLARRGPAPGALAIMALLLAGLAVFALLVDHPGLGGVLGLLGLGVSLLAGLPRPATGRDALAAALDLPVDLALVGAMAAAAAGSPARTLVPLLLLALVAWLPHLSAALREAGLPAALLWGRAERLGLLLLGSAVGRPFAASLLVLAGSGLDAAHRVRRLADAGRGGGGRPPAAFLRPFLGPDGRLEAVYRVGSALLCALVVAVLPREAGWRF